MKEKKKTFQPQDALSPLEPLGPATMLLLCCPLVQPSLPLLRLLLLLVVIVVIAAVVVIGPVTDEGSE